MQPPKKEKKTHPLPTFDLLSSDINQQQLQQPFRGLSSPLLYQNGKERSPKGHAGARDGGAGKEVSGDQSFIRNQEEKTFFSFEAPAAATPPHLLFPCFFFPLFSSFPLTGLNEERGSRTGESPRAKKCFSAESAGPARVQARTQKVSFLISSRAFFLFWKKGAGNREPDFFNRHRDPSFLKKGEASTVMWPAERMSFIPPPTRRGLLSVTDAPSLQKTSRKK